jgi:hypothetical protein
VVVAIAIGSIAATAFAATRNEPGASAHKPASGRRPAPRIIRHPRAQAISTRARFTFADSDSTARFECRLDRGSWSACRTPIVFTSVSAGRHAFSVRALDRRGRRSAAASFRWTVLEPKDFAIDPNLSGLGKLYPGAPPAEIAVTVSNPNSVPIYVTSLTVSTGASPIGCPSADNLALAPSSTSKSAPLKVPARGSVSLPTRGFRSPSIQLRDLPFNQDACQSASFPLQFSGSARG